MKNKKKILADMVWNLPQICKSTKGLCAVICIFERYLSASEQIEVMRLMSYHFLNYIHKKNLIRVFEAIVGKFDPSISHSIRKYIIENLQEFVETRQGYFLLKKLINSNLSDQLITLISTIISTNLINLIKTRNGSLLVVDLLNELISQLNLKQNEEDSLLYKKNLNMFSVSLKDKLTDCCNDKNAIKVIKVLLSYSSFCEKFVDFLVFNSLKYRQKINSKVKISENSINDVLLELMRSTKGTKLLEIVFKNRDQRKQNALDAYIIQNLKKLESVRKSNWKILIDVYKIRTIPKENAKEVSLVVNVSETSMKMNNESISCKNEKMNKSPFDFIHGVQLKEHQLNYQTHYMQPRLNYISYPVQNNYNLIHQNIHPSYKLNFHHRFMPPNNQMYSIYQNPQLYNPINKSIISQIQLSKQAYCNQYSQQDPSRHDYSSLHMDNSNSCYSQYNNSNNYNNPSSIHMSEQYFRFNNNSQVNNSKDDTMSYKKMADNGLVRKKTDEKENDKMTFQKESRFFSIFK
jgi:hypothetical protein